MFFTILNSVCAGSEISWEVSKSEFYDVPKLVTEFSISDNSFNVKIDRALDHVAKKCESECVSSTFRNTLREILLLLNDSFFDFIL